MNEILEEAIREAYAAAPADTIPLDTLELWHKTLEVPIRVVRWPIEGPEPTQFQLVLEPNAPHQEGTETITVDGEQKKAAVFYGLPFNITLPEKSQETPGEFEIAITGANDVIEPYLENAALSGGSITAIYRSYIKGRENDGPVVVWPGVSITSPSIDGSTGTITMKGSVLNWLNKKFGRNITPGAYPAAAGRG